MKNNWLISTLLGKLAFDGFSTYCFNPKIRISIQQGNFFKLLFGCPTANLRRQPHSPDAYHCVIQFRPEGHQELHNEVRFVSPAQRLVWFETGTFRFYHNTLTHWVTLLKIKSLLLLLLNMHLHYFYKKCQGKFRISINKACSMQTMKTVAPALKFVLSLPERQQYGVTGHHSGVFIVNFNEFHASFQCNY